MENNRRSISSNQEPTSSLQSDKKMKEAPKVQNKLLKTGHSENEFHGGGSSSSCSTTCRICYEDSKKEKLITPCHCTGTMGLIHKSCIEQWLGLSNSNKCEICDFEYIVVRRPKPITQWFSTANPRNDRRNLFGDVACFCFLSPLAGITVWLCASGAITYSKSKNYKWETIGLIVLSIFLTVIYVVWITIVIRYHFRVITEWQKTNQNVHILGLDELSEVKCISSADITRTPKNSFPSNGPQSQTLAHSNRPTNQQQRTNNSMQQAQSRVDDIRQQPNVANNRQQPQADNGNRKPTQQKQPTTTNDRQAQQSPRGVDNNISPQQMQSSFGSSRPAQQPQSSVGNDRSPQSPQLIAINRRQPQPLQVNKLIQRVPQPEKLVVGNSKQQREQQMNMSSNRLTEYDLQHASEGSQPLAIQSEQNNPENQPQQNIPETQPLATKPQQNIPESQPRAKQWEQNIPESVPLPTGPQQNIPESQLLTTQPPQNIAKNSRPMHLEQVQYVTMNMERQKKDAESMMPDVPMEVEDTTNLDVGRATSKPLNIPAKLLTSNTNKNLPPAATTANEAVMGTNPEMGSYLHQYIPENNHYTEPSPSSTGNNEQDMVQLDVSGPFDLVYDLESFVSTVEVPAPK